MKSIAWMTTDNSTSRLHDYEMTLGSVRSASHDFLSVIHHRQHQPRSQLRLFRTTTLKLKLDFDHHHHLTGQNLHFLPTSSISKFLKTRQTSTAKKVGANQQQDISTNLLVLDNIQTDGLNPHVAGDITLFPTEQPIAVKSDDDVNSTQKINDLPKI